jgi:glutamate dehydrogenase (NAD(P)+)
MVTTDYLSGTRIDQGTFGDQLGPEIVHAVHDPVTGMRGVVIIDNSVLGPAGGGTRMAPDVSLAEVAGLARAMTYKFGVFGLPRGGAKSGLWGDPRMPADDKRAFLRAFGHAIRHLLANHELVVGPDMGVGVDDVGEIFHGAGVPGLRSGLFSRPHDGDPAAYSITGFGVIHAAVSASPLIGLDMRGATVAIEGFGQVGAGCARAAHQAGAKVVAVSTLAGAIHDPAGLDVDQLLALRRSHGDRCVVEYAGGQPIEGRELMLLEVDVLVPGARPYVIHGGNAASIRARMIASGGNITVDDEAAAVLHQRGVLCLPDFVTSAGGIIASWTDFLGGSLDEAFQAVAGLIGPTARSVVEQALADDRPPAVVGRERVEALIASRRGAPRKTFAETRDEVRRMFAAL